MKKLELLNLTKSLIKFQSSEENIKAKNEIVDFIADIFRDDNVYIKKYFCGGLPIITVNLKNEKSPFLCLNGHLDVVPAEKRDFNPKVKGKRLYGRGAGDMKGQIAIMILAAKHFIKKQKRHSIGLMFTTDEETGGKGVEYLLKKENYKPKLAFIPDAGNQETIITKSKAVLHLRIEAIGKSCHGSYTWKGENAIDKLINVYLLIKKEFPKVSKKNNWKNTINLGQMTGGEIANKVPDYAQMKIDIRCVEETNLKEMEKRIGLILKKFKKVKLSVLTRGEMFFVENNNYYIQLYKKISQKILKKKVKLGMEHGASDARFFTEKKIPSILHSANMHNIHTKGEYLDLDSQKKVYQILLEFIENLKI